MSKLSDIKLIFDLDVTCTAGDNPCVHIENSHLVKDKDDVKRVLERIHETDEYKELVEAGYNRTFKSQYHEWVGHNVLYRLGYAKHRTGSVDIDNNESKWRKVIYAVLSIFGR